MRQNQHREGSLDGYIYRVRSRIKDYKRSPSQTLLLAFAVLFFFGLFCFIYQLEQFWHPLDGGSNPGIYVEININRSKVIDLKSSSGFTGRWERGSDPSDTVRRLQKHLNESFQKKQLLVALMKKTELAPTKVYFKIGNNLTYGDFAPLLYALQRAKIDHYALL